MAASRLVSDISGGLLGDCDYPWYYTDVPVPVCLQATRGSQVIRLEVEHRNGRRGRWQRVSSAEVLATKDVTCTSLVVAYNGGQRGDQFRLHAHGRDVELQFESVVQCEASGVP